MTQEEIKTKEWWDSLDDEGKYTAYIGLKSAHKSYADALHEITNHLLGEGWYCMAMDIYGANLEIVEAIKADYRDVNYSWSRCWSKIKKEIGLYLSGGK